MISLNKLSNVLLLIRCENNFSHRHDYIQCVFRGGQNSYNVNGRHHVQTKVCYVFGSMFWYIYNIVALLHLYKYVYAYIFINIYETCDWIIQMLLSIIVHVYDVIHWDKIRRAKFTIHLKELYTCNSRRLSEQLDLSDRFFIHVCVCELELLSRRKIRFSSDKIIFPNIYIYVYIHRFHFLSHSLCI